MDRNLTSEQIEEIRKFQKNEITEYYIYTRLSRKEKNEKNSKLLENIGNDEMRHYLFWKEISNTEVKPNWFKVFKFYWIARIFGITFGIKLMEKGEGGAHKSYLNAESYVPEARQIALEEDGHEKELIGMIEEKKLEYVGSIVLGLNDALVELTGTLAGLTFALQNTRLIAIAGLITGIAASFSMAASQYLSTKADGNGANALRSSFYTGLAYIFTVVILILPYFLFTNYFVCLSLTLSLAVLVILFFNYYISVAKDLDFHKRFWEMFAISMGVAAFTFGIGYLVRIFLGIDI
ncbi:MAG: rubrerythrin family protein [Bacteroidetes bacterium GWC2_33_15]|nr:MAG: rubrerythrin family protein [Bacteroidetes bacterium GWA2_33_15]OFX49812.1 MAG: rubrerythrin family protein [Bacteroidetes bacterium GWC2_33_15]OFX65003.1 MAG: rubrerythrin family protein [Bacteroidetes bacterium GWB2_32_14]OFX69035.1 MAG: rubrerythrin family protein [Bacteroidetes bacterium GWD2_33_33]HAN18304.1 rubrerythrin family protein [Bacteroidales bacterium]